MKSMTKKHSLNGSSFKALRAGALGMMLTASMTQSAAGEMLTPPTVAPQLQVPAGNEAFFAAHAVGTQNYVCRPVGTSVKFVLFTPEAVLTKDDEQLTSHYFSPNPFEANSEPTVHSGHMIRPTWRHSRDTSTVWAKAVPNAVSAVPDAIPWLLLEVAGAKAGPSGGATLMPATFIHRVNTTGGVAPPDGCNSPSEIGNQAFVPYTADYIFYKRATAGGQ
jgi:hypothetical protein